MFLFVSFMRLNFINQKTNVIANFYSFRNNKKVFGITSLLFLYFYQAHTQENVTTLKVYVYKNGKSISAYEVANMTLRIEGIQNDNGIEIKARTGDRLLFASASFENYITEVSSQNISDRKIEVNVNNDIVDLEAVTVHKSVENYSLFNTGVKPMTTSERRLFVSSYEKKSAKEYYNDFIEKGLVLRTDPLINMITGRHKKLKQALNIEQQGSTVELLENNYGHYLLSQLEIAPDQLEVFIYFVAERNKYLYRNKDSTQVKALLRSYYLDFIKQGQNTDK